MNSTVSFLLLPLFKAHLNSISDRKDRLQNYLESESKIALICCAVIFGSFAGAGAHHQGLRRLKPCQFQRTCLLALWMWQTLSKCSCSSYWRAVCCSWTRGRKANGPCLTRFQSAFVEVSSKVEVPGQLLVRDSSLVRDLYENSKWFGGRLSRSKICQISQGAMGSDSCCLAAWLRLLIKRELIELLFAFFFFFFAHFLFTLEAEQVFWNVYVLNKLKD